MSIKDRIAGDLLADLAEIDARAQRAAEDGEWDLVAVHENAGSRIARALDAVRRADFGCAGGRVEE